MAKIPIILEAGRADGKLIKTDNIYDDNQEKFLSDKIKEIDDNHNNLNNTINDLTDTVNNNKLDIENKLEVEQTRASNAENNLRETINNITELNENATSANIVTIDNIPNTSSSNVQQALNELFKNSTFAGIATPTTNPGTPNCPVFYFASKPGVYTNFSSITINTNEAALLVWNNGITWEKEISGFVSYSYLIDELAKLNKIDNKINTELRTKLPKDNNLDSLISDGSEEFAVIDSNNTVAFTVDKEGVKAKKYNICDENGNVVKTITKELLDKIEKNESDVSALQGIASSIDSKLPKDNDSDSLISDSSEEFVIVDSKNKIGLKVDNEGTKVRVLNICDENGNIIKTITKELFDKIEGLSQRVSKYGNTCKLQEKKGTYYEISAFSIENEEQDLKAEFSTNKSKFGERTLHLYVHGKEETELTSQANRGTVEISFNTPIVVKESLSFWIYMPTKCFINHRFESIKNPDPSFYFVFSGDNFSESFKMIPQYSISPSWMLYKILNKNIREKKITNISLRITTSSANPNMDAWIGCFVADQRFVPTINFNMDSKLSESVNSKFTDYLESNNIPANIMVRFGSSATSDGENIGKKLYFNGIVDAGVRNANVSIPTISDSSQMENINIMTCNYLKKVEGIRYYLENNIISNGNPTKPIIAAHCATNYIDDVLAHALKTCGYRIIRHGGIYNYRSYIDSESCFIGTKGIGFNSTIQSISDLTDEWKNNIETSFKEYVDDLIEWGMVGSFFTHEVKTREELATSWDSNAITVDVIEDCIDYVLEKEKAGLIQFMTLDNIYYKSVDNN